jgi:NifB/MoaA-like Fe-S oxidoreductase
MNTTLTTTNIGKAELKSLRALARKHNLKQVDFINHSISYFKKTGINPADEIFSPREEINKLTTRVDQIVRFIRTQEEKKLTPLLDELTIVSRKLNSQMKEQVTMPYFTKLIDIMSVLLETTEITRKSNEKHFSRLNDKVTELPLQIKSIDNKVDALPNKINVGNHMLILLKQLIEHFYSSLENRNTLGQFKQEEINQFNAIVRKFNQLLGD